MKEVCEQRFRFVVVGVFVVFLFSVLIVQYFRIQVIEHDKWAKVAKAQHQTTVKEPFRRGVFYSNTSINETHIEKPQAYALDILKFHLLIDPSLIPESHKKEMADQISKLLSVDEIYPHFTKKSRSRRIATFLSSEEKERVYQWWKTYYREKKIAKNALYFVKDYQRSYPFGKLLGQLLHTVRDDRDIETNQSIPTGGLETFFHDFLVGKEGKRTILRSPRYELDMDTVQTPPEHGADIYLTINHVIQAIAEEELAKGVQRVNGHSGWAVMMDPYSGEIYAMAQYPSFDPTEYRTYYNDPEMIEHSRNKPTTDAFEPGSTMKAITMSIAMMANDELLKQGRKPIFSPQEMMSCSNCYFKGRTQPLKDVRVHKYMNMYMAFQKSGNVYPARLVEKIIDELGPHWYREKLVEVFGLGQKSGVEIPYENVGMVPIPGKTYASGVLQWSGPTPYSLSIGYNVMVNSVQLVRAFAVFANGGYLVKPTILKKIVRDGEIVFDNSDRAKYFQRVMDESIAQEILTGMKFTTKQGGSSAKADIPGFSEAGKSGTSEKIKAGKYLKSVHFSSFIGIAPASKPRFVLYVGVDEPMKVYVPGFGTTHWGGNCAAPIFREIAKRSLSYLGEVPDDPYGHPKGDPRYDPDKADWVKEAKELIETYNQWNN